MTGETYVDFCQLFDSEAPPRSSAIALRLLASPSTSYGSPIKTPTLAAFHGAQFLRRSAAALATVQVLTAYRTSV
eukprot:CAMPEP_0174892486 /NCGR_PEP_ID=MMETSP0167-20121228/7429_1 /TAXON_ID=38298 /ORGANISM="Rhodella maculata, Strain CCMP736" /LENGTH=74 /DNA_ID=CAMNT_0016130997 /DNA_START=511 /DNA_END=735 /DNA_ORIENTATION=-